MKKPSKWRYETLVALIKKNNYQSYVEIGLGCGKTIRYLVKNIIEPNFKFHGIDPYEKYDELHTKGLRHPESFFKENMKELINTVKDDRFIFYNEYSHNMVQHFENDSIDIVFIDGNHTYKYVLQDMKDWYSVVRIGGILAGHDYYPLGKNHSYRQVGEAVEQFCKNNNIEFSTASDHVWYFHKK